MDTSQLLYQQGLAFHRQGLIDKAKQAYQQAIKHNPRHAPALHTLGVLASQANDPTSGLQLIAQALSVEPQNSVFLTNASTALLSLKRYDEALALCEQALATKPDHFSALRNQGVALAGLLRHQEAIDSFDKALNINPNFGEIYILRASAFCELKAYSEAVATADRVLALQPDFFEAHMSKANALTAAMRYEQACEAYDKALALQPEHAMAWFLRAAALERARRYTEAIQSYARAMAIDPQLPFVSGTLLHAKMLCCDWSDLQSLYLSVKAQVAQNKPAIYPFGYQAICDDEASLQACAQFVTQDKYPPQASAYVHPAWPPHTKIRLGYLCGEFREQATSILMTEVWERHDKDQFEIFAFDNGWDDKSPRRARIEKAFDHIINISLMQDLEVAELIHNHQIDILINLNVFFGRDRNQVFALRPSPIQVNYLGFPGTMGAPYMDYLIADDTVIPPSSQEHYTENVVRLPGCYQPNDAQRVISTRTFTRQELGLPTEGFVFCCFNNNYKITPTTFDVWMRILQQVPGSVLWLLKDTPDAALNLQREAAQRGVDPQRLVFAERMPNAEHLARHRMADLFLDTWPYNAHTTASDALWAGLPLLTLQGHTFPGRVANSLLRNLQLLELITEEVQAYEAMAVRLATNPDLLSVLRSRLNAVKHDSAPFKPAQHAKELEALFLDMMKQVH
jgi:predicted O-linked N-acetylglucosamine transferase (SPINDLY family)